MSSSDDERQSKSGRKIKFDRRNNNNFIFNALKKIKSINQQNLTMTWSVFLNVRIFFCYFFFNIFSNSYILQVLDMTARFLPPNMVFIFKIHSSGDELSHDTYHVIRDDEDYRDFHKVFVYLRNILVEFVFHCCFLYSSQRMAIVH